ncbi:MAG: D-tyrosyl-tRNA(Tyr) deacylase [Clostridia bacterium]|nr:D-tyrosyl-tRNA(Tyr) deacylase [Clostridia bacterium]
MRAVVQRVNRASVLSEGIKTGEIGRGLCVLLGVEAGDTEADARYMADKLRKLRIFEDENGKMNLSVTQVNGEVLCVSQFTLLGDARGQNRPGFTRAEAPGRANELYGLVVDCLREAGLTVQTGVFRTHMEVALVNDGPVTILLDSRKQF